MKIVLNPGHHVTLDPGAIGLAGTHEADIAMAVAEKVEEILTAAGQSVYLVQANDLDEITDQANATGAEVFVSVHCNGFSDPAARGTETWCYLDSVKGYDLAQAIQAELVNATGLLNRGVKLSQGLYVLKHTAMPAALVELAFITNPAEESLLNEVEYQQTAAQAIAAGIRKYFGGR